MLYRLVAIFTSRVHISTSDVVTAILVRRIYFDFLENGKKSDLDHFEFDLLQRKRGN